MRRLDDTTPAFCISTECIVFENLFFAAAQQLRDLCGATPLPYVHLEKILTRCHVEK